MPAYVTERQMPMKIECNREHLLSAVQSAGTVVPSRSPKEILKHLKLTVLEGSAVLMATDMDIGIRIEVPEIQVEAPGSVVLPVKEFGSLLRESTDESLKIEVDLQGVIVRGERSEFKLPVVNPEEFPDVPTFEEEQFHELPARLYREMIRRTLFATDTESSRYALGGVLLEFGSDSLIGVGTDGRRLAKMEGTAQAVNGHQPGDAMTIVPTRAMQLMERTLSEADAQVQIAVHPNHILVRSARVTVYTRLVEGRFPKWREVFPTRKEGVTIEIAVGPMLQSLRQAAVVASMESRGIDFTFGDGGLVLSATTAEIGQSRVDLPISYDGKLITVTLDHRYVEEFLRVLDLEKTFSVEIEDSESAALFTTDDGYGYVVMPLAREHK